VISVEKTSVPSLPDNNLARFIVGSSPPNKFEFNSSSTAYPVFLL